MSGIGSMGMGGISGNINMNSNSNNNNNSNDPFSSFGGPSSGSANMGGFGGMNNTLPPQNNINMNMGNMGNMGGIPQQQTKPPAPAANNDNDPFGSLF